VYRLKAQKRIVGTLPSPQLRDDLSVFMQTHVTAIKQTKASILGDAKCKIKNAKVRSGSRRNFSFLILHFAL
jgi:hypothetical protein